jgi:hypothetical protein
LGHAAAAVWNALSQMAREGNAISCASAHAPDEPGLFPHTVRAVRRCAPVAPAARRLPARGWTFDAHAVRVAAARARRAGLRERAGPPRFSRASAAAERSRQLVHVGQRRRRAAGRAAGLQATTVPVRR